MDPREKDEARFHRQETLARRIGKALDEMDSQSAGGCPDGEILAAYAERGLSDAETAKWESHFSTCSRCRKILLVLDASAGTPLAEKEVARLGELVAAAQPAAAGARTPSRIAWPRFDWRLRWLAPAFGIALVLLVFLALRKNRSGIGTPQLQVLIAQAPKPESAPPQDASQLQSPTAQAQRQQLTAPQADRVAPSNALNSAPSNLPASEAAKHKVEAGAPSDTTSVRTREAGRALQAQKSLGTRQGQSEEVLRAVPPSSSGAVQTESAPPSPAVPPPPAKPAPNAAAAQTVQLDAAANAAGTVPPSAKQSATEQAEPSPSADSATAKKQAPSEAKMAARKGQAFGVAASFQQDSSLLKAPLASTLWRAGIGGEIEQSLDGGATWATQMSPSPEDWLAGSAVSDTVCWLAGRRGAIARTVDGAHWDSVAPPPQAAGGNGALPDWTGISATDVQNATLTASDGRQFTTTDGGKTWRPQPKK